MHYFQNMSSASGSFALSSHRGSASGPNWGDICPPDPLICPALEKNPVGAHGRIEKVLKVSYWWPFNLKTCWEFRSFSFEGNVRHNVMQGQWITQIAEKLLLA